MRSKLLLAGLGLALGLVACEQILNLDKFQKCGVEIDCGAPDVIDDVIDASDAGDASDAFTFPDGTSEASSWARWRMDNTPVEVANGAPDASLTRFDTSINGELGDLVSGLRWSTQVGTAPNVTAASTFCTNNGYRLPTRIELVTLLDSTQQQAPFFSPAFLDFVQNFKAIWTSSYVRPIGDAGLEFWFADLTTGDIKQSTPANVGVLCVR